jgi:gentisate 1,2-dioxygenase
MATITKRELQTLPLQSKNGDVDQLLLDIQATHTKPLWVQMTRLNPPLPNPKSIPHLWDYDEIRPQLLRAGELITEKQAERRVLMLVNPARGSSFPSLLQHLEPLPDILALIQYR